MLKHFTYRYKFTFICVLTFTLNTFDHIDTYVIYALYCPFFLYFACQLVRFILLSSMLAMKSRSFYRWTILTSRRRQHCSKNSIMRPLMWPHKQMQIPLCGYLCDLISKCWVKLHIKPKNCYYYAGKLINGWVCGLCTHITHISCLNYSWIFGFQIIKNPYPILITVLVLREMWFSLILYITHVFLTPHWLSSFSFSLFSSIRQSDSSLAALCISRSH